MKWVGLAAVLVVAACEGGSGAAFTARNGVKVNPMTADIFEVSARPMGRASDFWCGAGNYASQVLGAPDNAPVYVVGGAGRGVTINGPDVAQFSLKPPEQVSGASGRAGSWGPSVGQATSVGRARQSCSDLRTNDD